MQLAHQLLHKALYEEQRLNDLRRGCTVALSGLVSIEATGGGVLVRASRRQPADPSAEKILFDCISDDLAPVSLFLNPTGG
jgi:hypothetical protein